MNYAGLAKTAKGLISSAGKSISITSGSGSQTVRGVKVSSSNKYDPSDGKVVMVAKYLIAGDGIVPEVGGYLVDDSGTMFRIFNTEAIGPETDVVAYEVEVVS